MGIVAHYHEDEYGMREILPIEFWPFCEAELGIIEAESAEHFRGSGLGWDKIHVLAEKPKNLTPLALSRSELVAVFAAHLPRYERVETGNYSHSVRTERHEGFGFNPWIGVFFDYDEKEIVRRIWLVSGVTSETERAAFVDTLCALSAFGRFLFVDWLKSSLMHADDRGALMRYFSIAAGEVSDDDD